MELGTFFAIVLTNFGTILALHSQTNRKIVTISRELQEFHGRLCALEERNRK